MIEFKLSQLARVSGGSVIGEDITVKSVSTDSRNCKGALFIAIRGERFDGHDFVKNAVENGAVAVGISCDIRSVQDKVRTDGISVLCCADTVRLLGLCGMLVRDRADCRVLSLTGSCGKTTVKEFSSAILRRMGETIATEGNFNNDIGVPLTLLNIRSTTRYAVIEQGASHLEDIKRTCEFVKPDVSLINNVGGAHIEGFGSFEGVYRGKSEILDAVLANDGIGIVPTDSKWFPRWKSDYATAFNNGRMLTFGTARDAFVQVSEISSRNGRIIFALRTPGSSFAVGLKMLGEHNAFNAAAAVALSLAGGASEEAVKLGLMGLSNMKGRLCATDYGSFTIIDDAYNASFDAVKAAIDTLSATRGYRVMIFGDMGELGDESDNLHQQVGEYAQGKVDELLCVGEKTRKSVQSAGKEGTHFNCKADLVEYALGLIKSHEYCSFLIKGSHAMKMDEITEALRSRGSSK